MLLDAGRVEELAADGKSRWHIDGLQSPLDAQVLANDRVLVTEFRNKRVSERNFQGEVRWERLIYQSPLAAQRLPNGNTFIVTHERVFEVRRDGSEVYSHSPPGGNITTAQKLTDGRIGLVLGSRKFLMLDAAGKEVRGFTIDGGVQTTSALDMLPGGRVLLAAYSSNKVLEYDAAGHVAWEVSVNRPISALRLPNGQTLVTSQGNVILELDRAGKVVKETKMAGHPTRARKR